MAMDIYNNKKTFFYKLKNSCKKEWFKYTNHNFLLELANNKLAEEKFKNYLIQDYIFLQQFLKILSLCAFKSKSYIEMNRYVNFITGISYEIKLHLDYCKKWKISPKTLNRVKIEKANKKYTDYVLKVGKTKGNFEIFTCLAPCIIGYGEIGYELSKNRNWKKSKYSSWIKMYSSKEYQAIARENIKYLDFYLKENSKKKIPQIKKFFKKSTQLEKNFWECFV